MYCFFFSLQILYMGIAMFAPATAMEAGKLFILHVVKIALSL